MSFRATVAQTFE